MTFLYCCNNKLKKFNFNSEKKININDVNTFNSIYVFNVTFYSSAFIIISILECI